MIPYYYIIIIGMSFLVSITVYLLANSIFYLKLFPPLLFATFLVEYYCYLMDVRNENNSLIYNIYATVEIPFYLYVLREVNANSTIKKTLNFSIVLFLVAKGLSFFFQEKGTHHFYAYNIGGIFVMVCSLIHLYQLLTNQEHNISPLREFSFWICFGLFCFFAGSFIIFGAYNVFHEMPAIPLYITRVIVDFLNVILYSSFIVAFILNFRNRKMA